MTVFIEHNREQNVRVGERAFAPLYRAHNDIYYGFDKHIAIAQNLILHSHMVVTIPQTCPLMSYQKKATCKKLL